MKYFPKKLEKIMQIATWAHLSEDEKRAKIEQVLSDTYDLGFSDGYAEGVYDSN